MKLRVNREALIKPLSLVVGVVERRQTLPILSNVLFQVQSDNTVSLTGTDTEVEMTAYVSPVSVSDKEAFTLPARKFYDICKSLPDGSDIEIDINDTKAVVRSNKSRFTLSMLNAKEFPNIEKSEGLLTVNIKQKQLKRLIDRTAFAMAQQDVRYFLNGMLWEIRKDGLRAVATDGHRLALCDLGNSGSDSEHQKVIVPRKGIMELSRLLDDNDNTLDIAVGSNHLYATVYNQDKNAVYTFVSKLVDGKFPEYQAVLPKGGDKEVVASRAALKEAFSRAAILSNEKYRGIRLILDKNNLKLLANNPEQEEAEENVVVDYGSSNLEIGFNVNYLIDVMNVMDSENIKMILSDGNSSALLQEAEGGDSTYVVMPMRL